MPGYNKYRVEIAGEKMLQHNGHLADPMNSIVKEMKAISSKRKKVDSDLEALADLEFRGGLYLVNGAITIPGQVIEANVVEGAKVDRHGKTALAGVFIEDEDIEFSFDGPADPKERIKDPQYRLACMVRVQSSKVLRTRPVFHNWKLSYSISVMDTLANESMVKQWIENAGIYKGLGDWRPRYGRFRVVSFEKVG